MSAVVDLADLGFERGAHLLVKRALRGAAPGSRVEVRGTSQALPSHLRAWCRAQGHEYEDAAGRLIVVRGSAEEGRWRGSELAGGADAALPGALAEVAPARWGLAPRGARVEAGSPPIEFALDVRDETWSDDAGRLYAQAAAAQWDPATAIDWTQEVDLPDEVEDAVVQVMTYLVENETAALVIPARFAAQVHPHFREVAQVLAVQAADEARHVEVFTRRALLKRSKLGLSTAGGQASLETLLAEPDFAISSFLLSVLGEGTFLSLLRFLQVHGPDPITRDVARLAGQDEARHVAFGLSHLARHVSVDPSLLGRLANAVERRHDALRHSAGLNEEVFDALVLMAAGSWSPEAIEAGHAKVEELERDMDQGRRARLVRLGFDADSAARLSSLHTRSFM